jgi:hypothetical protein
LGGRGRWISEFKASLVYRVSSRTARATQRNPVWKKKKKKKKKKNLKQKQIRNKNKQTNKKTEGFQNHAEMPGLCHHDSESKDEVKPAAGDNLNSSSISQSHMVEGEMLNKRKGQAWATDKV